MAENHIIKVKYSPHGSCRTRSVFQYDYGQVLQLENFNELPHAFEVHFSKPGVDETITVIGEDNIVKVPDECLESNEAIAWLFLHDSETDGETRFVIQIPIKPRKAITNSEPTEQEHDIVSEAIVVLNRTVEETNAAKEATLEAEENVVSLASEIRDIQDETTGARDSALAAADEAVRMAAEAEAHADDASSSASEAETTLENVQVLAEQAETASSNAQEYARQAHASMETASGSETNAAFSQRQARESMLATESIKENVAELKNDVTDLKDDVTRMRSQVFQSANEAAESATSAADSATAASASVQEVHDAVEDIVATTTASAETAVRSANIAQEAARNASSYAVRAESAVNRAESAANRASTSANNANRYASNARTYAASAERYATDAESAKEEIERLAIEQSRAIAPVQERQSANQAYNIGDYFVYNNRLYQVTSAIGKDETILPGTNCVQTTVTDEIKDIQTMDIHICTVGEYDSETGLPTIQNPDNKTFYLVPGGDAPNLYVEWVYINNVWEQFGSATIDLSGYLQKSDIDDTAGAGDTEKIWSADKSTAVAAEKADKTDIPVENGSGTGSIQQKTYQHGVVTYTQNASGAGAVAVGMNTVASGIGAFAEGRETTSKGMGSHVEGYYGYTFSNGSHTEGNSRLATGNFSHAEGGSTRRKYTSGGQLLWANANEYTCEFYSSIAGIPKIPTGMEVGQTIVVENDNGATITTIVDIDTNTNVVTVDRPFVTTYNECPFMAFSTEVAGQYSHAEGYDTETKANVAHAEGYKTLASGYVSHSAGLSTIANGMFMSAIGKYNVPDTLYNVWEANHQYEVGDTVVYNGVGKICIIANNDATYKSSKWQTIYQSTQEGTLFVVGNGEENNRSNAFRVDVSGDARFAGDVYVGCNSDSTGGTKLATINDLPDAPVQDVQVNGTSVVTDGVANVPIMSAAVNGVAKLGDSNGLYGLIISSGTLMVNPADNYAIKTGSGKRKPVTSEIQHQSVFYGLAKVAGADMKNVSGVTIGVYPEAQKSAITTMLSAPVTVSGTTPSITALPGVRYICGECSTLSITVPASGIIDVTFTSGSTATVLTVTPPTGMTIKWANGFDPTSLDADTVYEINIMDGCYGVVGTWT